MAADDVTVMPMMMKMMMISRVALDLLEASGTGGRKERHWMGDSPIYGSPSAKARNKRALGRMIWDVADEFPFYGYRKVAAELRRRGMCVKDNNVRRIMRDEGLRAIPRMPTRAGAGSGMGTPVPNAVALDAGRDHPNLMAGLEICRPDQAWAVDITCIRLETEYVFLAAVMDLFTRICIGWSLGRVFHHRHVLRALRKAFRARAGRDLSDLIVHSDRGLARMSKEYGGLLAGRMIRMSVSQNGCPGDNARMERFFETLKYENVRLYGYRALEDALENIREFIDDVYAKKRLHSALGYMTPAEFEQNHACKAGVEAI